MHCEQEHSSAALASPLAAAAASPAVLGAAPRAGLPRATLAAKRMMPRVTSSTRGTGGDSSESPSSCPAPNIRQAVAAVVATLKALAFPRLPSSSRCSGLLRTYINYSTISKN